LAGINPWRNKIIPRSLRWRDSENRRLHIDESLLDEPISGKRRHLWSEQNIIQYLPSSQIQISIFKSIFFAGIGLIDDREGQKLRLGKSLQLKRINFYFSRCHIFIDHILRSRNNFSSHLNDIFNLDIWQCYSGFGRIISNLRDAISITEIDKYHSS